MKLSLPISHQTLKSLFCLMSKIAYNIYLVDFVKSTLYVKKQFYRSLCDTKNTLKLLILLLAY